MGWVHCGAFLGGRRPVFRGLRGSGVSVPGVGLGHGAWPIQQDSEAPAEAAGADGTGTASARSRYRDTLRHRDLRLLIASFLVDQVGSWSYVVVISVYVFDRTHSTQWLAATGVCRWAPGLLLASYGGVIADRYERTTVMIVSSLASAALMTVLAVVVAARGSCRPGAGSGGPVGCRAGALPACRGSADSRDRR